MTRGRSLSVPAMGGRVLRAFLGPVVVAAALAAVLAFVGVLTPALTESLLTRGLRYDVSESTPIERDLTATVVGAPLTGPAPEHTPTGLQRADADVWGALVGDLASVRSRMPADLKRDTRPGVAVATSARAPIAEFGGGLQSSFLALAASPETGHEVRIVDGEAPKASTSGTAPLEMMLSRTTATSLHWDVGAAHDIDLPDGSSRTVLLSGIFAPRDVDADFWGHAGPALEPEFLPSGTGGRVPVGTGFTAAASLPAVSALPSDDPRATVQTVAWYPVTASALLPGRLDDLALQSRRFTSTRPSIPSLSSDPVTFTTRLGDVLSASKARLTTAESVILSVLVGPLGGAVALQLLIARLTLARARPSLELLGARGASPGSLRLLLALLVVAGSLPGAVVGGALAAIVGAHELGGISTGPTLVALFLAAVVPPLLTAAGLPRLVGSSMPLRLLGEALVVGVTIVAVILVIGRSASQDRVSEPVDPVSAVLPLLLALLGCVLALRGIRPALIAVRRRARRRRGPSLSTGTAVAAERRDALGTPLLAAVVGVAVALFASVLASTLANGLDVSARASVGADVRLTTSSLDFTTEIRFSAIPGVADASLASDTAQVPIQIGERTVTATAIVVDSATLRRVQAGVPDALRLPAGLAARPSAASGVPVVVSSALAASLGDGRASTNGTGLRILASDGAPNALAGRTSVWLLVDQRNASALSLDNDAPDTTLLRLSPGADQAAVLRAAGALVGGSVPITTATGARSGLSENPLVPGMRLVALGAAVLAALFGTLALLTTTILETADRRGRLALLTILGLDRHQRRRLVAVETLPLGLTALATGIAVAAAMVALVVPSVDLSTFTGSITPPSIHVVPWRLGVLVVVGVAAVGAVSALAIHLGHEPTASRPSWASRPTRASRSARRSKGSQ